MLLSSGCLVRQAPDATRRPLIPPPRYWAAAPSGGAPVAEPAFNLHDTVEYRWSGSGPFIGEARVIDILGGGRYRLERLDGTPFPMEGSIFGRSNCGCMYRRPG